MEAKSLCLVIRPENAEEIPLTLHDTPPVYSEKGQTELPGVDGDRKIQFMIKGIPPDCFVVLHAGEETIHTSNYHDGKVLHLLPISNASPFEDTIGLARLRITITDHRGTTCLLFATPVNVQLARGIVTDNLRRMSQVVAEYANELFGGDEVITTTPLSEIENRLKLVQQIISIYEAQYVYFSSDARFKLVSQTYISDVKCLKRLTPFATRWIATHPWELQQVSKSQGLSDGHNNWIPKRAPVERSARTFDISENRAVAGFPMLVAKQCELISASLHELLSSYGEPHERQSISEISAQGAARALVGLAQKLRLLVTPLQNLAQLYEKALGLHSLRAEVLMAEVLPPASPIFLGCPPYRLIYQCMQQWFQPEPINVETIVQQLTSLTGSRLYEYYLLTKFIKGIKNAGFILESCHQHVYTRASALYDQNGSASRLNTFVYKNKDLGESLRLWYQPVLTSDMYASENDIGLFRSTSWSIRHGVQGGLEKSNNPFYTPDFVLALEKDGSRSWAVIDAKYSTISRVLRHQTIDMAFKYLVSLQTTNPNDVIAGLWLACGKNDCTTVKEGSLFDCVTNSGGVNVPDIVLVKCNEVDTSSINLTDSILSRLRDIR